MLGTAVTLPMPEILAQAPELSPWTDIEHVPESGYDLPTAQAIDQLSDMERVDAAMCIPGITWAQKALLSYMVRFGYACPASYEAIKARRNMPERTIRNAVEQMVDKGIIKLIVTRLPNGTRHRFFVIQGGPLLAAYRIMVSGGATGPSPANLAATPPDAGAAPANLAATPPDAGAAPANLAGKAANLAGKAANLAGKAANLAGDGDVSRLVSSDPNISSDPGEEQTNPPPGNGAAKFAVWQNLPQESWQDSPERKSARLSAKIAAGHNTPPEPYWWPEFAKRAESVPGPYPPEWAEVSLLQHPADPNMNLLGEACARLLSTYPANPGRGERRIRNSFIAVIRAIYNRVLEESRWGAFPDEPVVTSERNMWFAPGPPDPNEELGF